jgi:hypothetical protein
MNDFNVGIDDLKDLNKNQQNIKKDIGNLEGKKERKKTIRPKLDCSR